MDKLKMQTPDKTQENIALITRLFPHILTETRDENDKPVKAIDFDLLKQTLSATPLVDDDSERYRLDWPGKKASLLKANTPINKTLRPCKEESVNFDTTENLYIEGDNFEVLKILQESYLNKVKMIYIDPPYNTGKDFIYSDKYAKSKEDYEAEIGLYDEEDGKLFRNTDSNGRFHSDWLSMMYERLIVARDLLRDDGVIFISIDDNEVHNLRKICDEVFGEENFVCSFMWKRKKETSNDSKNVAIQGEYILSYSKSGEAIFNNEPLSKEYIDSSYKSPTIDFPLGKWRPVPLTVSKGLSGGGYKYKVVTPSGNTHERIWAYPEKSFQELISKGLIYWGSSNSGIPQRVMYSQDSSGQPTTNYWDNTASNKDGKKVIIELFGDNFFDTTKPIALVTRLSLLIVKSNDIILDFFSGSATTAHAVMQLNAEDGGKRKFIMVQLPEKTAEDSEAYKAGYKTIAEIGKERIRRAGKKIIEELAKKNNGSLDFEGNNVNPDDLDTGFRVFKVDSTNMKDVYYHPSETAQTTLEDLLDNIKEDRTAEDLLTQVLLNLGLELSLPVEERMIKNNKVYIVQTNALVACFDNELDFSIIDDIAKLQPFKVVFKDSSFKDDKDRINLEERFKRLAPNTEISVL